MVEPWTNDREEILSRLRCGPIRRRPIKMGFLQDSDMDQLGRKFSSTAKPWKNLKYMEYFPFLEWDQKSE